MAYPCFISGYNINTGSIPPGYSWLYNASGEISIGISMLISPDHYKIKSNRHYFREEEPRIISSGSSITCCGGEAGVPAT
ncbi:UNVERIFIED_ORG: hypothetical protein DFS12_102471 [Chitinophaga ginsengisegetis]|nr:flavin-dependent dehydrogenase [Chitinophaga ginsengisegetis]MDR6646767.1 flavin-dependent dehydrogenase [Chitinophaga ginsengisegetis]MDR6653117.1 flavin-dependent dehydrogenase [Chitinophaga ginsengisegetis]